MTAYREAVADALHGLGCSGTIDGEECFCSRHAYDADHVQADTAVITVLGLERDRHTSNGRTDCGARAPWKARYMKQESRVNSGRNPHELHCTEEPGHSPATPHKDCLHSWTFWQFDEKDVTSYRPRNLAQCLTCARPWPCEEYRRLTQLINEEEE